MTRDDELYPPENQDRRFNLLDHARAALAPISDYEFEARLPYLLDELALCSEDQYEPVLRELLRTTEFFPTVKTLADVIGKVVPGAAEWRDWNVHKLQAKGQLKYLVKGFIERGQSWPPGAGVRPDEDGFPYPEVYEQVLSECGKT